MSSSINATVADNMKSATIPRNPRSVRFGYFLCWNVMSFSCAIFDLNFLLFERTLRRALHNHIWIVLLVICFIDKITDIPWFIRNDQYETPWQAPETFYLFWAFLDYFLFVLQIGLFSWATLARHIFIFHSPWLNTTKKRLFIDYLPMIKIVLYHLSYHLYVCLGLPCNETFNAFLNGGLYVLCAFTRTFLGVWELIAHQWIPTLIVILGSKALLVRVIYEKARLRQTIE